MESLGKILLLFRKDLILETRTKITTLSIVLFAFLVMLLFNFSFKVTGLNVNDFAPGILWITISFSGVLALSRIFDHERVKWAFKGLVIAPFDNACIFASKFLMHFCLMVVLETVTVALFVVLFNPAWGIGIVSKVLLTCFLATVGFSSVGVLVSSMLFNERLKDLLLPLVFYPLVIPLLIMAVKDTSAVVAGEGLSFELFMAGFDIIFLVASILLYGYVLEGD